MVNEIDYYQLGYDAASAGKNYTPPVEVVNAGVEAVDNWKAGYDTAVYDATTYYGDEYE